MAVDQPVRRIARDQPGRSASRDGAVHRPGRVTEDAGQTAFGRQEHGHVSAPDRPRQVPTGVVDIAYATVRSRRSSDGFADQDDFADVQNPACDRDPFRSDPEGRSYLGNGPAPLASGFLHRPTGPGVGLPPKHGDEPAHAPTAMMGV